MNEYEKFKRECAGEISRMAEDTELATATRAWMDRANAARYSYHFEWMGRPVIQYPQDILALQELIWKVQPDLIIETGIAHGGSLIFSASMLELNAACGGPQNAEVIGIDIDIRPHNRVAVEAHPMARRISMIEGSSIAPDIVGQVRARAAERDSVLVLLDSNHTHDHVLDELNAYADLVTVGSYCIAFDTVIEDMPDSAFSDRPWRRGNNAKTAVWEFLKQHPEFEIEKSIQNKLLITVAPDGYLKRIA
jgi:cephalosporin hydroxylase